LEASGLLIKGKSVVVGDNVLFPGAPEFLKYVLAEKEEEEDDSTTTTTSTKGSFSGTNR